jgi:uncharacterized protein (TIGR03382 family)
VKPEDVVATAGWLLLVLGWLFRRERAKHLGFVVPGMGIDLALVVYLEMDRSVIERTVERHYEPHEWAHILISTAAVVLYIPTIVLGVRLWRRTAGPAARAWHKRVAVTALALRTAGFAFMWTVA